MSRIARFLSLMLLLSAAAPALATETASTAASSAKAVFAGGCFWCMEPPYDKLDGVIATTSGYAGGRIVNPTYEQVSAGGTGHIEVIQVEYDPRKISYAQLLEVYWRNVDPFAVNRQFCDQGAHYRSAVFVANAEERAAAIGWMPSAAAIRAKAVAMAVAPASTKLGALSRGCQRAINAASGKPSRKARATMAP